MREVAAARVPMASSANRTSRRSLDAARADVGAAWGGAATADTIAAIGSSRRSARSLAQSRDQDSQVEAPEEATTLQVAYGLLWQTQPPSDRSGVDGYHEV